MRDEPRGGLNVSRETYDKLLKFEELVRKWSPRVNLVSRQDLEHLWSRHIRDSVQLAEMTPTPQRWLDLGSGSGFPGIVVAIVMRRNPGAPQFTLVESDKRKCAFLKTAARSLELAVDVQARRIEDMEHQGATTVSARALAPLTQLLAYAHSHLVEGGSALFPKGKNWQIELDQAKEKWSFHCDVVQSLTDSDAAVLKVRNIQRK